MIKKISKDTQLIVSTKNGTKFRSLAKIRINFNFVFFLKDHLKSKAITKEVFDKELDRLTEELKVINKSRSEKRQTNHKDENAQIQARGIYGPECKVWEIARESVIFMGGGRAVFLQLAHPYVASGVRQHSKVVHDIQVS